MHTSTLGHFHRPARQTPALAVSFRSVACTRPGGVGACRWLRAPASHHKSNANILHASACMHALLCPAPQGCCVTTLSRHQRPSSAVSSALCSNKTQKANVNATHTPPTSSSLQKRTAPTCSIRRVPPIIAEGAAGLGSLHGLRTNATTHDPCLDAFKASPP